MPITDSTSPDRFSISSMISGAERPRPVFKRCVRGQHSCEPPDPYLERRWAWQPGGESEWAGPPIPGQEWEPGPDARV
jgi:hypothetical protein